ncbi:MAG: ABC transporter permease subunit [Patescibacteria group bacterium]|nr:ABC transporter permease [Patescibacteria group bacterium]
MWTIIWRTLKDKKISVAVYCLAATFFMWMYVALFPTVQQEAESFNQVLENYPADFLKAFNIQEMSFDTIEKFLAIENYSIIWPIMALFMVVAFAGNAIAREIEKGTAEILLARPISRLKLFFSRYLAGLAVLVLFSAVSVFSIIPFAEMYKVEYIPENQLAIAVICFLFGWAVYSLAMMFSAIFSEKSRVYMATGGILILMYVINIIVAFKENLENLKYFSFFYYYDFNQAIIHGELNTTAVVLFASVAVACMAAGAVWFEKRDIAV